MRARVFGSAFPGSVVRSDHHMLGGKRAETEDGLTAVAAARVAAAVAHIAESFTDPELTLAAVARRQGVSTRYLQRLFEASGTSFVARVNELRLQHAFALLTEPRGHGCRISDIALQAGFSDVSHFNRLFRSRFGDSPSGIRARTDEAARLRAVMPRGLETTPHFGERTSMLYTGFRTRPRKPQ